MAGLEGVEKPDPAMKVFVQALPIIGQQQSPSCAPALEIYFLFIPILGTKSACKEAAGV